MVSPFRRHGSAHTHLTIFRVARLGIIGPQQILTVDFINPRTFYRTAVNFSDLVSLTAACGTLTPYSCCPLSTQPFEAILFYGGQFFGVTSLIENHVAKDAVIWSRAETSSTCDRTLTTNWKQLKNFWPRKWGSLTGVQSPKVHFGHSWVLHLLSVYFSLLVQCSSPITLPSMSVHNADRVWVPPPQLFVHLKLKKKIR